MAALTKKPIEDKDKTRTCDYCGYELGNEGVMYLWDDEEKAFCSFDCAIHADNPGTADEFETYDAD